MDPPRVWRNLSDALTRSPALTATMIALSSVFAVIFGGYLTPSTNVSAVPFVIPIVFAIFQNERWVWVTTGIVLIIYVPIAFAWQAVELSAGLFNLFGLILFGLLFSRVADQRQRVHRHAQALQRMERDLQFAMRNSNVRVFSHDTGLRYTWVPNPLPAFPREEMLGRTDVTLFPPEEAKQLMEIKQRAMDEEQEVTRELVVTRGGAPCIIRLTAVPTYTIQDGVRQKTGVTCVSVDLTDLHRVIQERDEHVQRQEEALAEVARAQGNLEAFTSLIAHDLRQPLTVIQGYADLIRRQLGDALDTDQLRSLDALNRSVAHMDRLVGDLRDVAAMEQGRFTINAEPVDLVDVVRGVIEDYDRVAERRRISCRAPASVFAQLDAARISQLVGNLLSNAIKYSPEDAEVAVEISSECDHLLIRVQDAGLGIAADDREQLFEMFSRLDNARAVQGLGLGLYISKAIAEAHGGSIEVESDPGHGSTFTVRLPRAAASVDAGEMASCKQHRRR